MRLQDAADLLLLVVGQARAAVRAPEAVRGQVRAQAGPTGPARRRRVVRRVGGISSDAGSGSGSSCPCRSPVCLADWTRGRPAGLRPGAKLRSVERKYVLKTPARLKSYRVDYDRELNDEQREVVLAGGRPHPRHRGRGLRQDAHARLPRLAPDRVGPRPLAHPPADLHEQGRARDAPARRDAPRRRHAAADGRARSTRSATGSCAGSAARLGLDARTSRSSIPRTPASCSRPRPRTARSPRSSAASPRATSCSTSTPSRSTPAAPSPRSSPSTRRTSRSSRPRSSRSSSATASASAWATPCDYDDLLLLWKRLLDEVPEAAGAARGPPTTTSSSTSTRTRTASRARSSTAWRRSRRTSRSSATTPRRSTRSAAPRSRTSSASRSAIPRRRPSG